MIYTSNYYARQGAQIGSGPRSIFSTAALFAAVLLFSAAARAATLYSEDFDDGNAATRWTTVASTLTLLLIMRSITVPCSISMAIRLAYLRPDRQHKSV